VPAVDVELPPEASSAAAARAALRDLLDPVPTPGRSARATDPQALDRVLLLTSEIVTNAILHARTPLRLTAVVDAGQVVVRVYDNLPLPPRRRSYGVDAGTGRGLHLLDALADHWGVQEYPAGKCVWFSVAVFVDQQAAKIS
jgi:anti-sigma regulatory factor (Ser/Thr protein kinase)